MHDKWLNGEALNKAEAALYRGQITRRQFMKAALAAGVAFHTASAMASDGEAAAINQLYNSKKIQKKYDFIVVGSGSGGCPVAGRLATETDGEVLLLEAGGTDQTELVSVPGNWPGNVRWAPGTDAPHDWGVTANPSDSVNGRSIIMPMGKVVGGGSAVNVMVWARGHKNDFNFWAKEAEDDAWNYESVLNIYRRIEDWQGAPDPKRRGTGGRLWVTEPEDINPIAPTLLDACESLGIPKFVDQNGALMESEGGAAIANVRIKNGRRLSCANEYIHPALSRPNMTMLTGAEVLNLKIAGDRVVGVRFEKDGEIHEIEAETQVILSAGAMNSPKILMQSGIGPEKVLAKVGIKQIVDLPGVGENFQDHCLLGAVMWEYKEAIPPRNNFAEATFFWKSDSGLDTPDLQPFQIEVPYVSPVTGAKFSPPPTCWSLSPGLVRPKSRGRLYLQSSDPKAKVKVDAGYLSNLDDVKACMIGIELCREIGNSPAMKDFVKREVMPGKKLNQYALANHVRDSLTTYFHHAGTCKMGTDEMSVVNSKLEVYGLSGLMVADASIMPRVATSNTMAPTVIIGERAADILIA